METKLIGNKIAEARKKATVSQAQLAERLFISPQAVGKWERGESMPDIITFNRLAEILGVDYNCYFENCAFKKVTFQDATLTNTFFKNKSLKGIRFIDCQADRMTYEFLKNGKADLAGITLLTS